MVYIKIPQKNKFFCGICFLIPVFYRSECETSRLFVFPGARLKQFLIQYGTDVRTIYF